MKREKIKPETEIRLTRVCAIKSSESVRIPDIIIGPEMDGSYRFNMMNISFYGTDRKGNGYRLDAAGNIFPTEGAYFDEEFILEEGRNFRELAQRLDERIQKRLVWSEDSTVKGDSAPKLICIGIR